MWSIGVLVTAFALCPEIQGLGFDPGYAFAYGREKLLGSSFGLPGTDQTFDYVVLGGGTAGLTIAARLAENANFSVAVIEAGSFYELSGSSTTVPALESLYEEAPPTIDWEQYTTIQPQLGGRSIHYPQGKCLGGSSGRNGMAYQRGTTGSYQAWADAVGDQSYTFPNLLPYFQRSVSFTPPNYTKRGGPVVAYDPSAFTSSGGPLRVSFWNYFLPVSQYFLNGLLRLKFQENGGIQSGSLIGFSQYPATLDPISQTRDSSETSFLQDAMVSTNIQIYQNSLAKQIMFNGKAATGVSVVTAGASYTLSATKEVILAAGPFRSPQLLMVSGIGPEATLKSLGIPVILNLPGVGQNFIDQPGFGVGFPVSVVTQHQLFSNATFAAQAEQEYITEQKGYLTVFGSNYLLWEKLPNNTLVNITSSARADLASFPSDWPDLQYILSGVGIASNLSGNYVSVGAILMKPTSRGNITINSTDTADNPVLSVNWLTTSTDQQVAIQAIRRCRIIGNSFNITSGPELEPGPAYQTDKQLLEYIQLSAGPTHHAVGSCKMGNSTDPAAVVDTRGRVFGGITGLRIVDSSIMPILPPGQPQATVYAIAEKLAQDILNGN